MKIITIQPSSLSKLEDFSVSDLLLTESDSRGALGSVEDDILALQEDVAKDCIPDTGIRLDTTEAGRGATRDRRIIHIRARNSTSLSANYDREIREVSVAWECVATLGIIIDRAVNLVIVSGNDVVIDEKERSASVGNAGKRARARRSAVADGVAVSGERPETFAVIDVGICEFAGELGSVDESEIVRSSSALL